MIRQFLKDESGVTAVEYGLIAALVGVVAIAGFRDLGGALERMYNTVSTVVLASMP